MSDSLRRAWESAKGDIIVAMLKPEQSEFRVPTPASPPRGTAAPAPPPPPEWMGIGVTTDSSLSLRGTASFATEADAGNVAGRVNDGVRALEKQASDMENQFSKLPPAKQTELSSVKGLFQKLLQLARAFRVSQDGKLVRFSGTWAVRDVEDLIRQAQALQKSPPPMPR